MWRLSAIAGCVVAVLAVAGNLAPAGARTGPVQLGAAVYSQAFLTDPDPRYRATLSGYDSMTAETAMKIAALQPQRGQFDFATADAIVAFAGAHGRQVFGHTLAWCADSTLPGWLRNGSWSRDSLLAVLQQHITTVMGHFRGRVTAWDVVNEALAADGTRRDCLWQRVIGDDWVEQAFRFARQADPGAKLFYNEVGAEFPGAKQDATVNLIRDHRERGVPIDGAGLQYHLTNRMPTQARVEEAIARFGALGVEVHISELDVPVWTLGSTVDAKFARQAQVYGGIAAACQAQPACVRITTWGFTDRYTWRLPWGSSLPLPFDSEYQPKAAWTAMQAALHPPPPPPPAPPPPAEPPTPPQSEPAPSAQSAAAAPAATPQRALALTAKLRRQGLRTWLVRRALTVLLRVDGASTAKVELVARLRGRVIARVGAVLAGERQHSLRLILTSVGRRLLRHSRRPRIDLSAVATDAGRMSETSTQVRPA